jgi:uncharacterized protein
MAKNCLESDLRANEVRLKKYFCALRPVLACKWIADKGTFPPMEFRSLLARESDSMLLLQVNSLLVKKREANEKTLIPRVQYLNDYISREIERCNLIASSFEKKEKETKALDELFRRELKKLV